MNAATQPEVKIVSEKPEGVRQPTSRQAGPRAASRPRSRLPL